MKIFFIITLFIISIISFHPYLFSQQVEKHMDLDDVLNFYPLVTGNKWIYDVTSASNPYYYYYTNIIEALGDTLAPNGKFYFHLRESTEQYSGPQNEQNFLERFDSLNGKVYGYTGNTNPDEDEVLIFDLNLGEKDTVLTFFPFNTDYYSEGFSTLTNDEIFNKWGVTKPRKTYHQGTKYGPNHLIYSLTQDIGLDSVFSYTVGVSSWGEKVFKGCVINGIVYGDTTIVSVEEENRTAANFILQQNYPNPFNPTTTINYQIPRSEFVTLKVYDLLGREVVTLVNEEKPAGSYKVEFNGSNISSGIYFYRLQSGSFLNTKKLLK